MRGRLTILFFEPKNELFTMINLQDNILNTQKHTTIFLLVCFVCLLMPSVIMAKSYDVLEYGARADGVTKDTRAVQRAIDACAAAGGGKVVIPGGKTVLTGTIFLKDHVTLYLENGAVLKGSPDLSDYADNTHKNMYKKEPHMDKCLIFARDATTIAIEGHGTIDGNGHEKYFNGKTARPMLLRLMNCRGIRISNISLINPAAWTSAWLYCDDIVVQGIRIRSRVNKNGDGLDFDGCTNVRVSDCSFDTSDDSICLQTSLPDKPCKNVVITNCVFTSKWAGMRIGLLSRGDFESVTVTNCTFRDIDDSGLKIQMNEGGTMRNMVFSNLVMQNVPRPVFMTFCQQRACVDAPMEMYPMKSMQDFIFTNIMVDNSGLDKNSGFLITGMPEHNIENILFKDINLILPGGGSVDDAAKTNVKEFTLDVLKGHWPEFYLVGTLPASAFYVRHVRGVTLDNISVWENTSDARPLIMLDDVQQPRIRHLLRNGDILNESDIKQK